MTDTEKLKGGWDEFRKAGLLWWTNRSLHIFGWAIVCTVDDAGAVTMSPVRIRCRGFTGDVEAAPVRVRYRGFTGDVEEDGLVRWPPGDRQPPPAPLAQVPDPTREADSHDETGHDALVHLLRAIAAESAEWLEAVEGGQDAGGTARK